MVIIIFSILITVILTILYFIAESEIFLGIFISLLFGFFALLLSIILTCIIGYFVETKDVMQPKIILSALKDNSTIEGQFYLFGGHIEGVDYYYYIEQKDGYKQKGKIKSEGTKVFEDGNNYIQTYKKEFVNPTWRYWALILDYDCQAEIHIPKNSITTEYNIDLK